MQWLNYPTRVAFRSRRQESELQKEQISLCTAHKSATLAREGGFLRQEETSYEARLISLSSPFLKRLFNEKKWVTNIWILQRVCD